MASGPSSVLPGRAVVCPTAFAPNGRDRAAFDPASPAATSNQRHRLKPAARDLLINIDNGGTLTDLCVIDGARIIRTKTITTPHDLSQCFFDGLKKASRALYGKEDLLGLLLSTSYIRYSTTQEWNALVESKGPRFGLILGGGLTAASMQGDEKSADMYAGLIGLRAQ